MSDRERCRHRAGDRFCAFRRGHAGPHSWESLTTASGSESGVDRHTLEALRTPLAAAQERLEALKDNAWFWSVREALARLQQAQSMIDQALEGAGAVSSEITDEQQWRERAERAEEELRTFVDILNEDADGRWVLDAEKLREGIKHPCALCGWSLDGHKYMYATSRGTAHLHCSHTLRAVEIDALKAKVEALGGCWGTAHGGGAMNTCVYCGEERGLHEFEDGLRCVYCVEVDELEDADQPSAQSEEGER